MGVGAGAGAGVGVGVVVFSAQPAKIGIASNTIAKMISSFFTSASPLNIFSNIIIFTFAIVENKRQTCFLRIGCH